MSYEPLPTRPAVRFEEAAKVALANTQLRRNMGKATQTIRGKRAAVVGELPDWQALREAGRAIKEKTLRGLAGYLVELESSVERAGGKDVNGVPGELGAAHGATRASRTPR